MSCHIDGSRLSKAAEKKQQRDAQRAAENRSRQRVARWRMMVKRLVYNHRWMPLWKEMLRSRTSPERVARRRLRDAFWRQWTLPGSLNVLAVAHDPLMQLAVMGVLGDRGPLSLRDWWIYKRANHFMHRAFPDEWTEDARELYGAPLYGPAPRPADWPAEPAECTDKALNTDTRLETRRADGRTDTSRSLTEAGLKTPDSARRGKKQRGGRGS